MTTKKALAAIQELVGYLYNIWIEMDACSELAQKHGATYSEVEEAKKAALNDSQKQSQAREQFRDLLEAMKNARLVYEFAEDFGSLPPTGKPN